MNPYANYSDDALIRAAHGGAYLAVEELAERYQRLRECVQRVINYLEDNPPPKQGARHES